MTTYPGGLPVRLRRVGDGPNISACRRPSWTPYDDEMVTLDQVAEVARALPRSEEALVRGRVKFRVKQIVWLAFSLDGMEMGFAFPKEMREALIATSPAKFKLPGKSDMRYNWVVGRLAAIDEAEMRDIVLDAWRMVVPKKLALATELP